MKTKATPTLPSSDLSDVFDFYNHQIQLEDTATAHVDKYAQQAKPASSYMEPKGRKWITQQQLHWLSNCAKAITQFSTVAIKGNAAPHIIIIIMFCQMWAEVSSKHRWMAEWMTAFLSALLFFSLSQYFFNLLFYCSEWVKKKKVPLSLLLIHIKG